MIQYLLALLSLRATQGELIVFNHVRGHSGDAGNEAADALARGGTTKPPLPDRDWPAEKLRVDELMRPKTTSPSPFTWRILKDHFEFVVSPPCKPHGPGSTAAFSKLTVITDRRG